MIKPSHIKTLKTKEQKVPHHIMIRQPHISFSLDVKFQLASLYK